MRDYNTMGYPNDPLNSNNGSEGYYGAGGTGILGFFDDMVGKIFFNDENASSAIMGELTGANAQQREFEQQEYLLEKQWDHDSAAAQMARAKAAGINPNLAAQGIVGGNVSATPATVSSNTQGAAGAANAISGIANAVTSGKASLAEAAFKEGTLQPTIDKISAEAKERLAQFGLTDAQRLSAENYLQYMDEDQFLDIQTKRVNVKRFKQEYKNARAQHQQILSTIKLTDEQYNLIVAQEGEVKAREAKLQSEKSAIDEELRYQTWLNEWAKSNGIRRDSNTFDAIFGDLIISDGDAEGFCGSFVDFFDRKKQKEAEAEQSAIERHSFKIAEEQFRAENLYKRASNLYELGSSLLTGHDYNWLNRLTGIALDGSVKDYRRFLDDTADSLINMLEKATNDEDKERIWSAYQEISYARSLPKRALMRYMNELRHVSNRD